MQTLSKIAYLCRKKWFCKIWLLDGLNLWSTSNFDGLNIWSTYPPNGLQKYAFFIWSRLMICINVDGLNLWSTSIFGTFPFFSFLPLFISISLIIFPSSSLTSLSFLLAVLFCLFFVPCFLSCFQHSKTEIKEGEHEKESTGAEARKTKKTKEKLRRIFGKKCLCFVIDLSLAKPLSWNKALKHTEKQVFFGGGGVSFPCWGCSLQQNKTKHMKTQKQKQKKEGLGCCGARITLNLLKPKPEQNKKRTRKTITNKNLCRSYA